ncbi:MAG: choice-of-anchor U domain-containing protein [bacterium]
MDNRVITGMKALIILLGILMILICCSFKCLAFPVWPPEDGEDRIGINDNNTMEFFDPNQPKPIIEYHAGDAWSAFPDKLTNKAHNPYAVQIFFDTNTNVDDRNLVLGVTSDAQNQILDIYFDSHHIGDETIQIGPFRLVTFWLGKIEKGSHKITIINQAPEDPDTAGGILFDFLELVSPSTKKIIVPDNDPNFTITTITDGILKAAPGDTVYVKKGIYYENIILRSGIILEGEDPGATIIDGTGKTVIIGAYQSRVKGFTIRNGGDTLAVNQGVGVKIFYDLMSLSNNIILSCSIGISLSGQDLILSNNTIANDDCCVYIRRLDANSPDPGVNCKNNIFSDSNCAVYVLSDGNSVYGIDPNNTDRVITEFSYNNVSTNLEPYLSGTYENLFGFGKGNIQTDPFFVDPNGGDYHLGSYSLCIDAGDPNADFFQEPAPNGQRINMGAFGNTPGATRTLDQDGDGVKDYIEGPADRDLNGKEDWSDNQTGAFMPAAGDKEIWIFMEGDANMPLAFKEIRAIEQTDPNISGFPMPESHILFGFWGFKVINMDYGAKVTVKIHFPQELFENTGYIAYDPNNGWVELPIRQDGSGRIVSIDLSDGGTGDMDRTSDGLVSHIGGISVDFPTHEDLGSIDCFIRSVRAPQN